MLTLKDGSEVRKFSKSKLIRNELLMQINENLF